MLLFRALLLSLVCLTLVRTAAAQPAVATPPPPAAGAALPPGIDAPPPPIAPAVITRDPATGRATIRAVRIAVPLRIDAQLDEAVYQTVPPISDFIQQEPRAGSPATERTEAWLLFDDTNVYVAIKAYESAPDRMVLNELRRDNLNGLLQNEHVAIAFDTFFDRRNEILVGVNALGGRFDGQVTNEREYNGDWNPVWNVRVGRFDGGWTVEVALPFKGLRYSPGRQQVWGFNVRRVNRWKNEQSYITRVPPDLGFRGIFQASLAAVVVGLEAPRATRTLELKPFATTNLTSDFTARPQVRNAPGAAVGLDVKYSVTQNLTSDFTVNTDFAQVEADEQQVNLTRFSLFFPEKREFFLENQGIFTFGGAAASGNANAAGDTPILFYSRRIGLNGGREIPIRGGGRLTGRAGRFSIGALNIQSADEDVSGTPATNFSILRIKRDLLRKSSVGLLATSRSISPLTDRSTQALGFDTTVSWGSSWQFNSYWAKTFTDGLARDDVSYRAQLDYPGDRYGVQLERLVVGDNFNPEVGFVRRDNMRKNYGQLRFSPRPRRSGRIRKYVWIGTYSDIENTTGRRESGATEAEFAFEFQNSDRWSFVRTESYEFLPQPFTISRGVTLPVRSYDFANWKSTYAFGQQRKLSGALTYEQGSFYNGTKTTYSMSRGRIEVTKLLSLEPTLALNLVDLDEGSFTSTVFGTRITRTVSPWAFASALIQYNSATSSVSANVRLRWEYRPGSELFIVYNEDRDTLAPSVPTTRNRALIFKVNRFFRY